MQHAHSCVKNIKQHIVALHRPKPCGILFVTNKGGIPVDSFAKRLKQIRKQAGLTQEQLAETIGLTRQAISRWEQGHTQPDMEMLLTLSQALHMDVETLVFGRNAKQYRRFQKKHLVCFISALACACVVFLVMTFLGPYIKDWVNRHYKGNFVYFWIFQLLLPSIGCFSLGFGLAAFVALFYNTCLCSRWKKAVIILGLLAIAPSLLVIIDDALGTWMPGYSIHITFALYFKTIPLPALNNLLYAFLPAASGTLMYLGFNKESEHKKQFK